MVSIDEMQAMLDEIAGRFPKELFRELNGGIVLLPKAKRHEKSREGDELYVLGEYHSGGAMGRYIAIYYGSFKRVFWDLSKEEIKQELLETVKHELRHHVESLAGVEDLAIDDEFDLDEYLSGGEED